MKTNILDLIRLYRKIAADIQAKNGPALIEDAVELLNTVGLPQVAAQLSENVTAIKSGDWKQIFDAAGDTLKLIAQIVTDMLPPVFYGDVANPAPSAERFTALADKLESTTLADQPVFAAPADLNMARPLARKWLADHRGNVRDGSKSRVVKFLLRNAPEVQSALEGTTSATTGLDPARVEQIINILRTAVAVLTPMAAFVPWLMPVVVVLKLIIAYYDSNHPTADVGLSLEDVAQ